ncbi:MAG: PilZ domain-containing protein [Lachnospiraceae bacterium]|nr:PilZ domain-containing protein [Lachnospiraceae bacterium]
MNLDRRIYEREPINLSCSFYAKQDSGEKQEFTGMLANISEGGIGIFVPKNSEEDYQKASEVQINSLISFQTFDEYKLFNEEYHEIIGAEVKVIRFDQIEDGLIIGCEFKTLTPQLENYIKDKKLISFITKSKNF